MDKKYINRLYAFEAVARQEEDGTWIVTGKLRQGRSESKDEAFDVREIVMKSTSKNYEMAIIDVSDTLTNYLISVDGDLFSELLENPTKQNTGLIQ